MSLMGQLSQSLKCSWIVALRDLYQEVVFLTESTTLASGKASISSLTIEKVGLYKKCHNIL